MCATQTATMPLCEPVMASPQRVVVIVDPYSTGRFLVTELASQQWPMVCIQSSQDLAEFWLKQHQPEDFVDNLRHEKLEVTLAALAKYEVVAVLPGCEPAVMLAEDLQEALSLPCNGAATKDWRRNKYDMQERLRTLGIRAVGQLYSDEIDEVVEWQKTWGQWPVIVKPSMSGGTDGVYWCHSESDVREAFSSECGKLNCNGVVNEKLLVQEYLDGLEYVVDCVSFEGKHVLSGIWVYKKAKDPATKSITYEYAQLIESTGALQEVLINYVFECLDALSIKYGPSHSEVIMCADGPCLVETGARLHGGKGPKMTELATGIGTHELVIDVALNGARIFDELHARDYRYVIKKWVFETLMRNPHKEGILMAPLDVPELRRLPSFMDILPSVLPGQELTITRDMATSPGMILQVHASLQQCLDDLSILRNLEETELYHVKPSRPAVRSVDLMSKQERASSPMRCDGRTSPYVMSPQLRPVPLAATKPSAYGNPQMGSEEGSAPEFSLDGMDSDE